VVVAPPVDDSSVAVDVAEDEQDVLSSAQVNQVCMVTVVLRLFYACTSGSDPSQSVYGALCQYGAGAG
jgi:hypothetical protein